MLPVVADEIEVEDELLAEAEFEEPLSVVAGLEVEVFDGQRRAGRLVFDTVAAFRFRDEMHSLGYAEDSYDTVVEIEDSDWLKHILSIEPESILLTAKRSKHFAVMLSSNGYLEVIARSVSFERE